MNLEVEKSGRLQKRGYILMQIIFLSISIIVAFTSALVVRPITYTYDGRLLLGSKSLIAIAVLSAFCYVAVNIWSRRIYQNTNNTRDSNLELCRVLCMLLVIMHHAVVHGGVISAQTEMTTNKFLALVLVPGGKLAFCCFIAMSSWFLVDQKFRMYRFLRTWLCVLFYSVVFSVVSFAMGTQFMPENWFSVFLPMIGNSHGYAAAYLAFYLLLPFLTRITKNISKFQARVLLALVFYYETVSQIVGYFTMYRQPFVNEIAVFILIYLLILNLKRWPLKFTENTGAMFAIFASIWVVRWLAHYYLIMDPTDEICEFIVATMSDESSVSNIIGGTALFFAFKNLKIPRLPIVNALASGVFGILLFHDHNFFRYNFWGQVVRAPLWYDNLFFPLLIVFFSIWTFAIGFCIDYIQKFVVERKIMHSMPVRSFCAKFDELIEYQHEE